jgi:hypothetical protein
MKYTYEQALMFAYKRGACRTVRDILQNYNTWEQVRNNISLSSQARWAAWFAVEMDDCEVDTANVVLARLNQYYAERSRITDSYHANKYKCPIEAADLLGEEHDRAQDQVTKLFLDDFYLLVCAE